MEVNNLVVGDIIFLDEGMRVPADCILIESYDLQCDESIFNVNNRIISKNILE
jgi:Ca2+-transporting ATPase